MDKAAHYLAFQGGSRRGSGPFGQALADLQVRANYIRRVQQTGEYIDPVLRFHLGLDPVKPPTKPAEPQK